MRAIPWLAILSLLTLTACDEDLDEAGAGCTDSYTELAADEVSALGFSADEVLAAIAGSRSETLQWADGPQTSITVEAIHTGGPIRFVDSEPTPHDGGMDLLAAAHCEDRVEIEAQVTVTTDDGLLNETFDVMLAADEPTSADFTASDLAIDDLAGDYQIREIDTSQYDTVAVSIHVGIGMEDTWGQVSEFGEYIEQGNGDSGVAMAENVETGAWPLDLDCEEP